MQSKMPARAVGLLIFLIASPAQPNVVTPDDSSRMIAEFRKVAEFNKDLADVGMALARSMRSGNDESLRTYFCFAQVQTATDALLPHVYAATFVIPLSAYISSPMDERVALQSAKLVLAPLANEIASAQSTTNRIFGEDCGRRQLIYDHAKKLRAIADAMKPFVSQLLARVEAGN